MRKMTVWFFVVAVLFAFDTTAQTSILCQENIGQSLIPIMSSHYVPLNTKRNDGNEYKESGIITSETDIVTSFHCLKEFSIISLADGTTPSAIFVNPKVDLAILQFEKPLFKYNKLTAGTVIQGDRVYIYSNALGRDGVYQEYIVSKVDKLSINVSPMVIEGSSGAAVYNGKGEIIGIVSSNIVGEGNTAMGLIIPATLFSGLFK